MDSMILRGTYPKPYGFLQKLHPEMNGTSLSKKCRHSGGNQNPVKTVVYWMLVSTSMTRSTVNQMFPKDDIAGIFH